MFINTLFMFYWPSKETHPGSKMLNSRALNVECKTTQWYWFAFLNITCTFQCIILFTVLWNRHCYFPNFACAWTSLPSDHHQFDSFLQLDFRSNVLPSRKTSLTLTSISKTTSLISPVILYHIILAITLRSSYHTCDTFLSLLSLLSPLPFWMWAPQELYPQQLNYD